ncbi:MAG TPA: molybdopterin-dependent oxidoreductase [Vicinamibacterales bacterium]|nr:molybdopterin-dependent oxidoreductase [Vicinamibacterales bacterium]
MTISRRRFAKGLVAAGATLAFDRWLEGQALRPVSGGRLVRSLPLGRFDGRPAPPLETLLGAGLDARQFTDLSDLDSDHLQTPVERFYIRTSRPASLPDLATWQIVSGGLVTREQTFDIRALEADARDVGLRVMECSGNSDPANFGLLSAARWAGTPIAVLLDRASKQASARRVRITGFDDPGPSATSTPGASWIFTADELERTGALLALRMNGEGLTPDHGAPVRLLVPNYYGCSCIKWVTRIDWVADDAPATPQMMEFSARTHQAGVPRLARDYEPPAIDLAALPIRVEQWMVTRDGRDQVRYRVVGLRWGGTAARAPLTIRFRHSEPFVPVDHSPDLETPGAWSLWSHEWAPAAPGRYQIALGVSDPGIRVRRLDLYYYTREVEIDAV